MKLPLNAKLDDLVKRRFIAQDLLDYFNFGAMSSTPILNRTMKQSPPNVAFLHGARLGLNFVQIYSFGG